MPRVKARVVRISSETYEHLEKEARRRGMSPDALAAELLTAALDRSDSVGCIVSGKRDIKQFRQACKEAGLDSSLINVLRSMRGLIVDARIAYPETLHVEIKDSAGKVWRLATQDAEWSPADPADLIGRSVDDAAIDAETGELRCKLSDGSLLDVKPAPREAEDDLPNWELITPGGIVLELGPGVRWQIGSADSPASFRAYGLGRQGPGIKS